MMHCKIWYDFNYTGYMKCLIIITATLGKRDNFDTLIQKQLLVLVKGILMI